METKNAIIESASICSDKDSLTILLKLKYAGNLFQLFGMRFLRNKKALDRVSGNFIYRSMKIAGASDWSEMLGKSIRAKADEESVIAIGHIIDEDWFCPSTDYRDENRTMRDKDGNKWLTAARLIELLSRLPQNSTISSSDSGDLLFANVDGRSIAYIDLVADTLWWYSGEDRCFESENKYPNGVPWQVEIDEILRR